MLSLREQLAAELRRLAGSDRFGFIAQHRGMFSRLGASPEQVERLRAEHGIYMVGDQPPEHRGAEPGHGAGSGAGSAGGWDLKKKRPAGGIRRPQTLTRGRSGQ